MWLKPPLASAPSIYAYAIGNAIYILGITGLFLLQNIIIADISVGHSNISPMGTKGS